MRRRRFGKWAKWAGLATIAVILAVYVAGAWWSAWFTDTASVRTAGISGGAVFVQMDTAAVRSGYFAPPGFHARREHPGPDVVADFDWLPMPMPSGGGATFGGFVVPLWVPLFIVATPTYLLWRSDRRAARRAMAGRCTKCAYDRHGLAADAKCPECGTVPAAGSARGGGG